MAFGCFMTSEGSEASRRFQPLMVVLFLAFRRRIFQTSKRMEVGRMQDGSGQKGLTVYS